MEIFSRLLATMIALSAGVHAPASQSLPNQKETHANTFTATPTTTTTTTIEPYRISATGQWDWDWLATLKVPPLSYWLKVAQCETESDWQDGGHYAGGLGIAYTTWLAFGGLDFAPKQYQATQEQQIIIANRIALHGYQNPNGDSKQPVGFTGWGCIRNNKYLTPPVDNPSQAWRKYVKSNQD
jgi:hypothetical protein